MTVPAATPFPFGVAQALQTWTTDTFRWMLLDPSYEPIPAYQPYVADVSSFEIAAGAYARVDLTTPTINVVDSFLADQQGAVIEYLGDGPDFGVLTGGDPFGWLVLFHVGASDADSLIVCALKCAGTADAVTPAALSVSEGRIVRVSFDCPIYYF